MVGVGVGHEKTTGLQVAEKSEGLTVSASGTDAKKSFFNHQAQAVVNGQVEFLDFKSFGFGGADAHVAFGQKFATGRAGEADDFHAARLGSVCGMQDIFGIAGGGDGEQRIARATEAPGQLRIDILRVAIVAKGGDE